MSVVFISSSPPNLFVAKQVVIKWDKNPTTSVGLIATTGITLSHMRSELEMCTAEIRPWWREPSVGRARLSVTATEAPKFCL